MKQLSSHQFENIYKQLGVDVDTLGCVMLDVDGSQIEAPNPNYLYYTSNPKRFWINGFVAGKTPHVTLLYGLMVQATLWQSEIEQVLAGWKLNTVTIANVGWFPSQYDDEPYSCIIANVEISPKLLEGHQRLQFLPHIDTFTGYKAHITLAYIKDDESMRNETIAFYNQALSGKTLKVKGLNFGGDK